MKRIFSLILAFCFVIFGGISVSAASVANNATAYPGGASSTSGIGVAVISSVSRYAIDVTFSQTEFTLNSLVWDVNNLDYILVQGQSFEATPINVTVTNYSDKPILAWGSATANTAVEIHSIEPTYTVDNKLTIPGVVPDGIANNTNGVNGKMAYYINVPAGWSPPSLSGNIVIGTVSVYLAKP
ncbi:MAG: hypothetical protein E7608_04890 [Ruminococcaceae bacterium]|nr:hypothetical protein [Oscillospiraceae bacterium]